LPQASSFSTQLRAARKLEQAEAALWAGWQVLFDIGYGLSGAV
jgi:hypothetical protein